MRNLLILCTDFSFIAFSVSDVFGVCVCFVLLLILFCFFFKKKQNIDFILFFFLLPRFARKLLFLLSSAPFV